MQRTGHLGDAFDGIEIIVERGVNPETATEFPFEVILMPEHTTPMIPRFPFPAFFSGEILNEEPERIVGRVLYLPNGVLNDFKRPWIFFFQGQLNEFLKPVKNKFVFHLNFKRLKIIRPHVMPEAHSRGIVTLDAFCNKLLFLFDVIIEKRFFRTFFLLFCATMQKREQGKLRLNDVRDLYRRIQTESFLSTLWDCVKSNYFNQLDTEDEFFFLD
jgi:hypothetical protein